jgi:hypothetical protein
VAHEAARRDHAEPLDADLRRLHVTVSRRLLEKLEAARAALSHARPSMTTGEVVEAALDLLLAEQARKKGLTGPRRAGRRVAQAVAAPALAAEVPGAANHVARGVLRPPGTGVNVVAGMLERVPPTGAEPAAGCAGEERSDGEERSAFAERYSANEAAGGAASPFEPAPAYVPAAVRRAVWERDGGRCQWPLAAGGVCGAASRVELDHVVPRALGGGSSPGNLRLLCRFHNRLAARVALGDAVVDHYVLARRTGRPGRE